MRGVAILGSTGSIGTSALRVLARHRDRFRVVALTAYGREQDRRRSSQAGFDAHLLKPASYEDLTRVLARVAGGG